MSPQPAFITMQLDPLTAGVLMALLYRAKNEEHLTDIVGPLYDQLTAKIAEAWYTSTEEVP